MSIEHWHFQQVIRTMYETSYETSRKRRNSPGETPPGATGPQGPYGHRVDRRTPAETAGPFRERCSHSAIGERSHGRELRHIAGLVAHYGERLDGTSTHWGSSTRAGGRRRVGLTCRLPGKTRSRSDATAAKRTGGSTRLRREANGASAEASPRGERAP